MGEDYEAIVKELDEIHKKKRKLNIQEYILFGKLFQQKN